jgi:hypothetical protein
LSLLQRNTRSLMKPICSVSFPIRHISIFIGSIWTAQQSSLPL